jgi:hypothetical protein
MTSNKTSTDKKASQVESKQNPAGQRANAQPQPSAPEPPIEPSETVCSTSDDAGELIGSCNN